MISKECNLKGLNEKFTLKHLKSQNKYFNNDKNFANEKRNFCYGGFMYKRMVPDSEEYDWISTDCQPKDFLTLVRFTVMVKLSTQGKFAVRQFLSADSNIIFVILKINQKMVK